MDAELKTKWVAALRSGEFRQATGKLRDGDPEGDGYAFCCLGVLCVVKGAAWQDYSGLDYEGEDYVTYSRVPVADGKMLSLGEDEELNEQFLREIGIPQDEQSTLVGMNDGNEKARLASQPFEKIAAYIESKL